MNDIRQEETTMKIQTQTQTQLRSARPLALGAACALALALGCDPDALKRRADEAQAEDQKLTDALERENARIDMAAQEALASAEANAARGGEMEARPGELPNAAEPAGGADDEVAPGAEPPRDEFVMRAREQLRRMQSEVQGIEARTHRGIEELDANIEEDQRRAAEQLDRMIDESQEGYAHARDAVARELRELEERLQRLRQRVEDEA
jgi:hypothetical protein